MIGELYVYYRQHRVGVISRQAAGTMQFQYEESWKQLPERFPISLSLPLDGSFNTVSGHYFFANLLPEGNVREQICRSLKISNANDFELLRAIGGDCAGALTITASQDNPVATWAPRYEAVSEEQLARWSVGKSSAFASISDRPGIRLSLAGAQDKLPVHVADSQILLPLDNTPSTHILKFASRHYSHLPENETFITLLAREVGLPVVDVKVRKTAKASVTLIARYDRVNQAGQWFRLHQEDFCQALGIDASRKYEKEGGPSIRQCVELIKRFGSLPLVDLQNLLRWTLFNLLVGNADAHGKNLSLLYSSNGTPSLAPFYDLVCTRNYKPLSRETAMNIGGIWNPDKATTQHFDALASDFGFPPSLVLEMLDEMMQTIHDLLPTVVNKYAQQFGDSPVLERLPIIIRKLSRRLKSQLK